MDRYRADRTVRAETKVARREALRALGLACAGCLMPTACVRRGVRSDVTHDLRGERSLSYELEYLFSRRSRVRPEIVGMVAAGFRINLLVEGGEVRGPALNGTCGHGGDWFTIRRDGVGIIDSRVSIHADDGALVYLHYTGVVDLGADAFQRLERGEVPAAKSLRVAGQFQTAAPQHAWLNRILAVGIGLNDADGNLWDTYALR
jgi:hypothetical protein